MKYYFAIILIVISLSISVVAEDSSTILKLADKFYRDSLSSMALEQYQRYLATGGSSENSAEVTFKVAELQERLNDTLRAIENYSKIINNYPSDVVVRRSYLNRAGLYNGLGKYLDAAEDYLVVWRNYSGTPSAKRALLLGAKSLNAGGDLDGAIRYSILYSRRFKDSNDAIEAIAMAISAYIKQDRFSEARSLIGKVGDKSGTWGAEIVYYFAYITEKTSSIDSAITLYSKLLSSNTEFSSKKKALVSLGNLIVNSSRNSIDSTSSKVFLSTFGKYEDSLLNAIDYTLAGDISISIGDSKLAISSYNTALKNSPSDTVELMYKLARAYSKSGNPLKAVDILDEISKIKDSEYSNRALLKIADIYYQISLFTNSVESYRRFYDNSTGDKRDLALYKMGKIYKEKLNSSDLALREFDKLLRWFPSSRYYSMALWNMGELYEQQGELKKAAELYGYLSSVDRTGPKGEKAKKRLEYLENYRLTNLEGAVVDLTELALDDKKDSISKRVELADILKNNLKKYYRSGEIIDSILEGDSLSDSLRYSLIFKSGEIWESIYKKMTFEDNGTGADYAKKKAISRYDTLLVKDSSQFSDRAKFNKIGITNGGITEYEKFVADHPESNVLPEAAFFVAEHYRKASVQAPQLMKNAISYYEIVLKLGLSSEYYEKSLVEIINGLIMEKELDRATGYIGKFEKDFPNRKSDEQILYFKGALSYNKGEYKSAIGNFKLQLNGYPTGLYSGKARLFLAHSLFAIGNVEDALNNYSLFLTATNSNYGRLSAIAGKAKSLLILGRAVEARDFLLPSISSGKASGDIYYNYAVALEMLSDKYGAIKEYKRALSIKNFTMKYKASISAANLLFDLREYQDAYKLYDYALPFAKSSEDSAKTETRFLSSAFLAGAGEKYKSRYKLFRGTVAKANSEFANEVLFSEGLYLYRNKDFTKSKKRFDYILKKQSSSSFADDAAYYSALILYDSGNYEDAITALNRFVKGYGESEFVPSALFTIAVSYQKLEKFAEGAKAFEVAATHPKISKDLRMKSYVSAANLWQKISGWEDAARVNSIVYDEFRDVVDSTAFALKTGFAWFKADRIQKALGYFEIAEADKKSNDRAEIAYWTALCYSRLGKSKEALERFLRIPYIYGNSGKWGVTSDFEAAKIYETEGEFLNAISLYRKIVRIEGANSPLGGSAQKRINSLKTIMEAK